MTPLVGLLVAGVAAFLVFNFPVPGRQHATVFLGDAGSTWLGLTLAWIVIALADGVQVGGHGPLLRPFTALWLLAVPVIDAFIVMVRRRRHRRSPFDADHDHLHYVLRRLGLSVRNTVLAITLLTLFLGFIGLALQFLGVPDTGLALGFALVFVAYARILRRLQRASGDIPPTDAVVTQGARAKF